MANCAKNHRGANHRDNLEIAHADEEAYMFELVVYEMQFLKYKYDQLNSKLIETKGAIGISQIFISMELVPTFVGIHSELVVTIVEVLAQMRGGSDSTTIPRTLLMLPIILVDAPTIVASTQVGDL